MKCPEVFFQPNLINLKIEGIHKYIFDSIQKCDLDIRKELMKNIVLSGGSTLFSGMKERLKREM
jgi:actin-related protein